MLQTFFLSKVANLMYANPEYEPLLLQERGYDAMFRVSTDHGIDLLYCTRGTGL